ncbi:hypothetical protein FJZ53_07495 [Candidatus Woesearchaeota archaeon]|nr:hypothetical protein [Candidatus Woesearchaeota archaeon]
MLLSLETQQVPFPHLNPAILNEMVMYHFPPEDIIKDDVLAAEATQTTEKKTRKRSSMSNEGKEVWEMNEEKSAFLLTPLPLTRHSDLLSMMNPLAET